MVEFESKIERMEMEMIRWMCGVSERQTSSELGRRKGVDVFVDIIKNAGAMPIG